MPNSRVQESKANIVEQNIHIYVDYAIKKSESKGQNMPPKFMQLTRSGKRV